jgi:hypothetical protein
MAKIVVTKDDFVRALIPKDPIDGYQTFVLPKDTILFRGKNQRDEPLPKSFMFMADFEHTKEYMNLTSGNYISGIDDRTFEKNPVRNRCNMFQSKKLLTLFALTPENLKKLRNSYPKGLKEYKELTAYTGLGSKRPLCALENIDQHILNKKEEEVVVCPTYLAEEYAAAKQFAEEEIAKLEPTTDPEQLQDRERHRTYTIRHKMKELGGNYLALRVGAIIKLKGFDGWVWMPGTLASIWSKTPYIRTDLHEILVWDWESKFTKLDIPCYTMDPNGGQYTGLDVESVMAVLNGGPNEQLPKTIAKYNLNSQIESFRYNSDAFLQKQNESDNEWARRLRGIITKIQNDTSKSQFIPNKLGPLLTEYEAALSRGGRRRRKTFRRSRKLKKGTRKIR